jgi:hypothetical protein
VNQRLFTFEQYKIIETRCIKSAQRSLLQLHEMKKISLALVETGVEFTCIKGPQLSHMLYGREALKESVDLDIMLVHSEDLNRVHNILADLGYKRSNLNQFTGKIKRRIFLIAKREIAYFNHDTRCAVDLHIRPGANTYLTEKYFTGFLKGLVNYDLDGTTVPVLPDEKYLVYLCYHGALHQFSRLAWLMDIRAFIRLKKADLDFNKVFTVAASMHIERCVWLALLLIREYFNEQYDVGRSYPENRRLKRLTRMCKNLLYQPANYALSRSGRFQKLVYAFTLIKGLAGKTDWLFGVLMRQLLKVFARPAKGKIQ